MDITNELRQEYDTLRTLLQRAAGSSADKELALYLISCWCAIWSQNERYCPEYARAASAILSDPPTISQMQTAFYCCRNSSQTLAVPPFFHELLRYGTEQEPELPQRFLLQLNQLLVAGACCNGDFTIPEANAVSAIVQQLSGLLSENALPFDRTLLKVPSTTALNEPSYRAPESAAAETHDLSDAEEPVAADTPDLDDAEEPAATGTLNLSDTGELTLTISLQPESSREETPARTDMPPEKHRDLEDLMDELDSLIGLEQVKQDVHSLTNFIRMANLRRERNLKVPTISYHLVFTGNPGTGKTTIARLVAQIYHQMGLLAEGQLIEADRSTLVGGYLGQTAIKTQKVIQSALGGVLFIDEAYSLVNSDDDSYGREAIETILKAMEDHRDELVVIVAGYDELMHKFIRSNPGLASRFNKYFHFPDYNGDELCQIFLRFCRTNDYQLQPGSEAILQERFGRLYESRDEHFGNARSVRNLFEKTISCQADRLAFSGEITDTALMTLTTEDLENAWKEP